MTYRLKRFRSFLLLAITAAALCITSVASAQTYVRGYYRSNGTYVAPHYRSNADGDFDNNWTTKGNHNPYTGEYGTRVTPIARTTRRQFTPVVSSVDPIERRLSYEDFYNRVEGIAKAADQVSNGRLEQNDVRTLQLYLRKLRRDMDRDDWKQAERTKKVIMSSRASQRSLVIALDAERRLTKRQRADEERRHRERIWQWQKLLEAEEAQTRELERLRNGIQYRY
jgi:hypothetical protein